MKNQINTGMRKVLVTLICHLPVILAALILGVTGQIAGWVAHAAIALSLGRLTWLFGWGAGKNGWRYYL